MNELSEGAKVDVAWTCDDKNVWTAGKMGITSMVVSMQAGQGGMVPWIRVESTKGLEALINCANLEGVKLTPRKTS